MSSHLFIANINIDQISTDVPGTHATLPEVPQKVLSKPRNNARHAVDAIELGSMHHGSENTGPDTASTTISDKEIPTVVNDLEMSRPSTPTLENEIEALQSFSNPPINRYRVLSICFFNLGAGLNDSVPGVLIPYLEKDYNIGYAVVSMIFVTNALGFISSAFFIDAIRGSLGRSRTFVLGSGVLACGYIIILCSPSFAAVVFSFYLLGFGRAISAALSNVFLVNLQNATYLLGMGSGSYGLGGTIGPLIATYMVTSGGLPWNRYYIVSLSLAIFNAIFMGIAFWNSDNDSSSPSSGHANTSPWTASSVIKERFRNMVKAFKNKTVLIGALLVFSYQGAEVSISGWVTSFLITVRHGDPSSVGYVTAGFWGGITIGRFLLSGPANYFGEKAFVYAIVAGAAAFQLLVWLIPNVIGDGVAVAIVGLLLGPIFPCVTTVFSRNIPRSEHISGLSVISAFGSSGGAVAPFTTGILAQAAGTFVLHPIAIGLFATMMVCWFFIPGHKKRRE